MRLFIGFSLSQAVKKRLGQAVGAIKEGVRKGRYSDDQGYHLTVKFLGEVDADKVPALIAALKSWKPPCGPFGLQIGELGTFSKRGGDILWAGIEASAKMESIHESIEILLEPLGFPKDVRPYRAHLTLARGVRLVEDVDALNRNWHAVGTTDTVDRIVLFHSTRVQDTLAYVPLAERKL